MKERLALEGDEWINNRRGELTTYLDHDEGERYVIGADLLWGCKPATTQLPILDSKSDKSQLGEGTSTPTILQRFCITWGLIYNDAMIIVENNSHGILTCTRLGKDMAYPHFYQTTEIDKVTERETTRLGFHHEREDEATGHRPATRLDARGRTSTQRQDDHQRDAHLHRHRKRCDGS